MNQQDVTEEKKVPILGRTFSMIVCAKVSSYARSLVVQYEHYLEQPVNGKGKEKLVANLTEESCQSLTLLLLRVEQNLARQMQRLLTRYFQP
jgi:hypothetical protein